MVDFMKAMTPEQRKVVEARQANFAKDVAEHREMTNDALKARTEYYLSQSEFPTRYQPGEPVYDGAIAHVVIPELLRRLVYKVEPMMTGEALTAYRKGDRSVKILTELAAYALELEEEIQQIQAICAEVGSPVADSTSSAVKRLASSGLDRLQMSQLEAIDAETKE